jgi:hypothetical protein
MRARVRAGHRLTVIDMSPGGALVEVERALRPGSRVDVHLETDELHGTVSARVVRCAVVAIDSHAGITYRAALAFIETCDLVREALTHSGCAVHVPLSETSARRTSGDALPALRDELPGTTAGAFK